MAIDKITPIRLDKSSDYKLVPKTSMVDALNMLITESESSGETDTDGDLGVLKNIKGNHSIEYAKADDAMAAGEAKIIGSVTDTKLKIVYFFVWHTTPSEHGVWAYDPFGKLPEGGEYTNKLRKIHKSNLYKFPQHGFVKGNIVYTSQTRLNTEDIKLGTERDFEKDTILYFTDNTNEPRKINVYMAMSNVDDDYSPADKIDFITACPKTPLTPIVFEFDSDQTRTTSNFKSGPGFQFAYQFISKDGVESAISPYSDIAFSPGIINQGGLTTINHALHNRCVLRIPEAGAEIESIRILARQFNNPELVVLDEVSNTEGQENWVPNARAYFFYNDRIVRGVSTNEVNKQFDNLPRKAQAQSVVDNRLMYGNYLEGFNNVKIDPPCGDVVSFEERGVELIDLVVKLIPAISEQQWAYNVEYGSDIVDPNNLGVDEPQSDGARNKSAGYIIDCREMPLDITTGDVFNVSVTISPNNNFHLYQATDSYHQSRHRGAFQQFTEYQVDYSMGPEDGNWDGGDFGGNTDDSASWVNAEGEDNAFYGHQGLDRSGANWIKDRIPPLVYGETMTSILGGADIQPWGIPYSGNNHGVSGNTVMGVDGTGPDAPKWKTVLGGEAGGIPKRVNFGTSAGNPLIIKGAPLTFSCKIKALANIEGDGRAALSSAISQALTGQAITWGGGGILETVEAETEVIYDLDLDEIDDGKQITEDNYLSKLIVGVVEDEIGGEEGGTIYKAPIGHFIVKKADVMFYLEKDEPFSAINPKFEMLRLCIGGMENVETYSVFKKKFYNSPWFAFSKDYLEDINPEAFFTDTSYGFSSASGAVHGTLFQYDEENTLADWDYIFDNIDDDFNPDDAAAGGDFTVTGVQIAGLETEYPQSSVDGSYGPYSVLSNNLAKLQEQRFLGYLDFDQSINQFFRFNKSQYESQPRLSGLKEIFPFSLVDGEGGMGGNLTHNLGSESQPAGPNGVPSLSSSPRRLLFKETFVDNDDIDGQQQSNVLIRTIFVAGPVFTGTISSRVIPSLDEFVAQDTWSTLPADRSYIPLMQGDPEWGLSNNSYVESYQFPYSYYYNQAADWPFVIDFPQKHSYIEILNLAFLYLPGGGTAVFDQNSAADRTFKSNADHDFGIIYYDERGRHGFVNHLKTVYVPGYSAAERLGALHGRSIITLTLNHAPPKWAHYYKLAYTKNTSVQNFVQYSAGGAFHLPDNTGTANVNSTLIYVSLNYLQESSISYVAEWGARSPEGGLSMFKYIDGVNQKLRIISAYTDSENRDFFFNYEFDIVNIVLLGETDNPLGGDETEPEKLGEFVVLKNNPNADGFNYASVVDGSSKWDNNCIIELFTPSRDRDEESRFYYEIGDTYNVNNPETDSATHSITDITLDKGDVWWRRVPVNLREYSSGDFQDLILDNTTLTESSSSSNFKPYYLETETASDLFKADATLIGRPNIILEDSIESIREASITYSGKSNPNSSKINYSSFNLTLSNFKDLQEEFGDINYMCNMEGDVFVIQSDRCTLVPASKTLFSDVSGTDTVAASKSPLGQERVFAGRAGCDNNPESVVQVGAFVYFAHKNLGKVYRFNPSNGVQEISDQGMASYFRGLFKRAIASADNLNHDDLRVVGGFDPVKEEYLLTVLYNKTFEEEEDDSDEDGEEEDGGLASLISVINHTTPLDLGDVERSAGGSPASGDFTILNESEETVTIKLRGLRSWDVNPNAKYPTQFGTGYYRAPWFTATSPAIGETITLLPNTPYNITVTALVTNEVHSFLTNPTDSQGSLTQEEAEEVLLEAQGSLFRSLTDSELANVTAGGSPLPQGPGYVSIITFDAYRSDGTLINSVLGEPNATEDIFTWQKPIKVTVVDNSVVDDGGGEDEEEDDGGLVGDIDGDGVVGTSDLLELTSQFGDIDVTGEGLSGDLNGDGAVITADLLLLLDEFGNTSEGDELGVPPLDLCSYPVLQDAEGNINSPSVLFSQIALGNDAFFNGLPTNVSEYVNYDLMTFIATYISNGPDLTVNINCNIDGGPDDEQGESPINFCLYPELQDENGMITYDSVVLAYNIMGNTPFFAIFPSELGFLEDLNWDFSLFLDTYQAFFPINCNIG